MIVVVSDTSPIRALAGLGLVEILARLFQQILVPPGVVNELLRPSARFQPLRLADFPFLIVRAPTDIERVGELRRSLDEGESEAIALAIETRADWLLIDERDGARMADALGLRSFGVLGVLIRAKQRGLVPVIDPLIDRLIGELGFHVSLDVRAAALRLAGEDT